MVGSDDPRFALEYSDTAVGRGVLACDDDLKKFCVGLDTRAYRGLNLSVRVTRSSVLP